MPCWVVWRRSEESASEGGSYGVEVNARLEPGWHVELPHLLKYGSNIIQMIMAALLLVALPFQ